MCLGMGRGKPRRERSHEKRRCRRRKGDGREGEVRRAAIELGNVINGPGPVDDEDEDNEEDVTINQGRMGPMMNPMGMGMGMGVPMNNMQMGMQMPMGYGTPPNAMSPGWPGWGQQQQAGTPNMLSPAQFMVPPPADPAFYAAHQQAMIIAKQAYQMAVAQQAMAVAGEEWERGSTVGGFAGLGSVYGGGGGSVYGGGGGSVYGGGSVMGGMQGMSMGGWSPGGGQLFPPAPRSMYGRGASTGKRLGPRRSDPPGRRAAGISRRRARPLASRGTFRLFLCQRGARDLRRSGRGLPASPRHRRGTLVLRDGPPPSSWKPGA
ncbi:hypothetical protein K438DRAFT_871123 [Mycena galopus ATCC 62051]|nr:hypothetical protein K438DRAFT_871123 [Mycena galopus ATCC 62051]